MEKVSLVVDVPIACFRQSRSSEYIETYPVPPPSTVYGMLLSLVGETNRFRHCGVHLAVAMMSEPSKSVVLRKVHRFKVKNSSDSKNVRPDYQEILSGIKFAVSIEEGEETTSPCLMERILGAFSNPSELVRFGGLSCGESQFLVNSIDILNIQHNEDKGNWLVQCNDGAGHLILPYWVDHISSQGTRWKHFKLQDGHLINPPDSSWIKICPN